MYNIEIIKQFFQKLYISYYCTRAINNRGLYSGKTFWALVCGYYLREVTIQEKLFCTSMSRTLFAMSTIVFHRNFYNFECRLQTLELDSQDLLEVSWTETKMKMLINRSFINPIM